MEGNLPPRALVPGGSPFDLDPSMQQQQQFHFAQPHVHQGVFAAPAPNPVLELGNVVKTSLSDEEDADDPGKAAAHWHRVRWTSDMVKLLVSAVSYIDEDVEADHGSSSSAKRKHAVAVLKKKGKWKVVSVAMNERGFAVSPQQCEDKFNDLNKRYKRLTEILGRGKACRIVENPALLEKVSLSAKLKEEAKKHLNSKHLHYEEMCSYHNRNRLCLLDDPALQRSLRVALWSGEEQGKKSSFGYDDDDDQMLFSDDDDEDDECNDDLVEAGAEDRHQRVHSTKKLRHDHGHAEETHWGSHSHLSEAAATDTNKMFSKGPGGPAAEKNPSAMHLNHIEQQRLKIKAQMLKIEQRHFKWLRFSKEKDRELEKMRLENERMALENERMDLELKLKELGMGIKPKRIW